MGDALAAAGKWWSALEVDTVAPDDDAMKCFIAAMEKHQLGRKRVLAATYRGAGITSILTLNSTDFAIFTEFICLGPLPSSVP